MSSMGSNRIVPLQVLRTLERYASEERPMSNLQIIARIQEDERVTLARNTVAAAVAALESMGYVERTTKGSYAVRLFDETELRVLIDGVMASRYLPPVDARYLIDKLMQLGSDDFARKVKHVHMADQFAHQGTVEFLRNIEQLEDAMENHTKASFYRNRVLPDGTVRQIYFYCVDVSEFAVNKLADRGSLSARGIVTNVQDFVVNLQKGLGL